MMHLDWKKYSGVILCAVLTVPAYFLGKQFPIIGGPIFGILIGMVLAYWRRPEYLNNGIKLTSKYVLQGSIIMIGFGMNLYQILSVGSQSLAIMIFTLAAAFITAFAVGKLLSLKGNVPILIGVGTAVCGGSAIAAAAPVVKASDKDIAFSISTIFLFNIIAVFIFPAMGHMMGMTDMEFGMWAGTAINDTSSVVAAGYTYSSAAGDYATIVKLTRTLMIIPITLVLALWVARSRKNEEKGKYSIAKIFPWFVLGFLATSIIATSGILPSDWCGYLNEFGKIMITMAMVAIGLSTKLNELVKNGLRPIALGMCCWISIAVVSLICIYGFGF